MCTNFTPTRNSEWTKTHFGVDLPDEYPAEAYPGYAAYGKVSDMPRLYSGCYGLGSRDLQPEALLAAVRRCAATKWAPTAIRTNAERFGLSSFIRGLSNSIEKCLAERLDSPTPLA